MRRLLSVALAALLTSLLVFGLLGLWAESPVALPLLLSVFAAITFVVAIRFRKHRLVVMASATVAFMMMAWAVDLIAFHVWRGHVAELAETFEKSRGHTELQVSAELAVKASWMHVEPSKVVLYFEPPRLCWTFHIVPQTQAGANIRELWDDAAWTLLGSNSEIRELVRPHPVYAVGARRCDLIHACGEDETLIWLPFLEALRLKASSGLTIG